MMNVDSNQQMPTLNQMDWLSKDSSSNEQGEQDLQDAMPANEGDATANEGANAQADAISAAGDNQ